VIGLEQCGQLYLGVNRREICTKIDETSRPVSYSFEIILVLLFKNFSGCFRLRWSAGSVGRRPGWSVHLPLQRHRRLHKFGR